MEPTILEIILFSSTRISTISNFIVPRGFSFHTGFIIWCICSGFLLEFFESLLLSGQMKPKYDDFVKTRMDLINRDMTLGEILMYHMYHVSLSLVLYPGQQWVIDFMRESSDPVYNLLAEKTISLENDWDWKKTDVLIENHVLTDGTHAYAAGFFVFASFR